MATLTSELVILLSSLIAIVFLWRFVRDKDIQNLTPAKLGPGGKVVAALVIPIALLFLGSGAIGVDLTATIPYFLAGAIVPYILSQVGVPPFPRSLLILGGAVAFSLLGNAETYKPLTAALIGGLFAWKIVENVLLEEWSTLEDVLPAFLWLVGMYWTQTADSSTWIPLHQKMIAAVFVVVIFLRWIQGPFLKEDKMFVKRICLALTGGLFLLVLVTKVLAAMQMTEVCAIVGAGFFLTYLLSHMDKTSCESGSLTLKSFKQLVFIGIFTLLAERLFGTFGLIVLAASTLIATTTGVAYIAGLYWGTRAFLQCFIYDYNSNMTGINVMHPYVSAALYGGLLIALTVSMLLKSSLDRRAKALLMVSAGVVAAPATNFFLHAEPTASLLNAALAGAVIVAVFGKAMYGAEPKLHENLMLVPGSLIAFGILTGGLIELGNSVDSEHRMMASAGVAVLVGALVAVANYLAKKGQGTLAPARSASDTLIVEDAGTSSSDNNSSVSAGTSSAGGKSTEGDGATASGGAEAKVVAGGAPIGSGPPAAVAETKGVGTTGPPGKEASADGDSSSATASGSPAKGADSDGDSAPATDGDSAKKSKSKKKK